jgi:plastocyanin
MRTISVLVAALALALAGCGGSSNENAGSNTTGSSATPASNSGGSSSGGLALSAPADGSLKFDKTALTAKAGKVTIDFDNQASIPHGIGVKGNGVDQKSDEVTNAKTSVTVNLKPGTYEFYCPVPGHEQAGMKGTLTVQ